MSDLYVKWGKVEEADGAFRDAFLAKGRFRDLLEAIPVRVIRDDNTALYGAARYAAEQRAAPTSA